MGWQIDSSEVASQTVTSIRMGEHFCLKWNNHQENLTGIMTKLLDEQKFVDVSLVCEMKTFKAHQTVLSACSPYFEQVLGDSKHPHPIIILRDVKQAEMSALLQYMYRGEVNVRDDELTNFLNTAQALQVRGLSENKADHITVPVRCNSPCHSPTPQSVSPVKRRRRSSSTIESTASDKIYSDAQQTNAQNSCKASSSVSQKPTSNITISTLPPCYSENNDEVSYVDLKTPSQAIKQEDMSPANEDMYHGISHTPQNNPEYLRRDITGHHSSVEPQHKEWNMDYEPSSSHYSNPSYETSRNYLSNKVELPKVPTPMTHSFSIQLQASPPVPALFPCSKSKPQRKEMPHVGEASFLAPKMKNDSVSLISQSVIQPVRNAEVPETHHVSPLQRKGGRFRPGWMENYSWLQYDENMNMMFCRTCRKWSGSVPDIRTSFVEGNSNFRLEIVNHHDKSKAHKLCMAKEMESIPRLDPINPGDSNQ